MYNEQQTSNGNSPPQQSVAGAAAVCPHMQSGRNKMGQHV